MSVGRINAERPDGVSNPVDQKPKSTTSPRPKDGNQPNHTENTKITMMPIKNVGSDIPMSDRLRSRRPRKASL